MFKIHAGATVSEEVSAFVSPTIGKPAFAGLNFSLMVVNLQFWVNSAFKSMQELAMKQQMCD